MPRRKLAHDVPRPCILGKKPLEVLFDGKVFDRQDHTCNFGISWNSQGPWTESFANIVECPQESRVSLRIEHDLSCMIHALEDIRIGFQEDLSGELAGLLHGVVGEVRSGSEEPVCSVTLFVIPCHEEPFRNSDVDLDLDKLSICCSHLPYLQLDLYGQYREEEKAGRLGCWLQACDKGIGARRGGHGVRRGGGLRI
jgi:hypothetical protein